MKPAAVNQAASSSSEPSRSTEVPLPAGGPAGQPAGRAVAASGKPAVSIRLAGKEYRIRSDASEEWLQKVADHVDKAMQNIRERTNTVDSLDIALLAALNLAREVLRLQSRATGEESMNDVSDARLRNLIDQIELELPAADSD